MKTLILSLLIMCLSCGILYSQNNQIPLIGTEVPAFTANTTNGVLKFPDDFGDSWKILLSHPRDFTPVCTSEIYKLAQMQDEFKELDVKILIISTDGVSSHFRWKESIESIEREGIAPVKIEFPFLDDRSAKVSRLYGMLDQKSRDVKDVRGVFIIDSDNIVQSILFYPMKVGRNFDEIKRAVIALQTVDTRVLTPANWNPGDDILVPVSPHLDIAVKDKSTISKNYYNIGSVMWYKKL